MAKKKSKSRPNIEELKAKKDIKGLIKLLKHENEDVRMYASIALADLGEEVLEPCIKALKDRDENLRWGIIWVLSKIGKPAIEPLNKLINESKDEGIRICAQMALDMMIEEGKIFFDDL